MHAETWLQIAIVDLRSKIGIFSLRQSHAFNVKVAIMNESAGTRTRLGLALPTGGEPLFLHTTALPNTFNSHYPDKWESWR